MSNRQSVTFGRTGGSKTADENDRTQIIQNVVLVWLDDNIDNSTAEYGDSFTQLRGVVNTVKTFTNVERCIRFIDNMTSHKICMIVSGSLGQSVIPQVHTMIQVDSIIIYCGDTEQHEEWSKEWPKVRGVFKDISLICQTLENIVEQCEQNTTSICFVPATGNGSDRDLDQLDASFMYSEILKEILLTIEFQPQDIKKFIDFCRLVFAGNERELQKVKQLDQTYHDKTPIWWYTSDSFLRSMVNRALQIMDMNMVIKIGFFIRDLHRHIQQLYSQQFKGRPSNDTFTVYRGKGMQKTKLEQLTKIKGGLASFNTFMSANKNRDASLNSAQDAMRNPDLVGVLFVMTIDPSKTPTPFAVINDVSSRQSATDEVLFSMHTVFRIHDIKPLDENNRLFQVDLTLTKDEDKSLRMLSAHIRQGIYSEAKGWSRLSALFLHMGHFDEADEVNRIIYAQTADRKQSGMDEPTAENENVSVYNQRALIKYNQAEFDEAIQLFQQVLEINRKILPPNHPELAKSYNNIGMVYNDMGDYPQALSSYEKVLEIQQQSLPPNHPDFAQTYIDIGSMCQSMGDYSKALSFYEKALDIQQRSLAPQHPNLGETNKKLGSGI